MLPLFPSIYRLVNVGPDSFTYSAYGAYLAVFVSISGWVSSIGFRLIRRISGCISVGPALISAVSFGQV